MTEEQRRKELERARQKNRLTRLKFENAGLRKVLKDIIACSIDDVPADVSVHARYPYLVACIQSQAEYALENLKEWD